MKVDDQSLTSNRCNDLQHFVKMCAHVIYSPVGDNADIC